MKTGKLLMFAVALAMCALAVPRKAAAQTKATTPRNLVVDDFLALKEVGRAQISPDGQWVAYAVRSLDINEDTSRSQIWMVPAAGGPAIALTAKGVSSSSPKWSPDGKHLAFLSSRGDGAKTQVWTLFMGGGEAQQATETIQGVSDFEWSPDATRLVLLLQDASALDLENAQRAKLGEKPKKAAPPPFVIDRQQFKRDTVGYLDRRRTHLYVLTLATGKLAQVTSGDYDDNEPAWSADGRFLAFTSNRTQDPDTNYNTDIWTVAADNTDKGATPVQVTKNPGTDHAPAWSPDGKWIACVSQTDAAALDYATHHLTVTPSAGGETQIVTLKRDRNVIRPQFAPDGKSIYAMLEEDGVQPLARIAVPGGNITILTPGRLTVRDFTLTRAGAVAATVGRTNLPNEIFSMNGAELKQISHVNDAFLATVRLGNVDYAKARDKNGLEVAGNITYPPDYVAGRKYPAILRPHGGPVSQTDASFDFTAQLFAANGYVVLQPNYRGSAGYGQKFSQAIFADWGNLEYVDLMTFLDDTIARGIADPDRLGVGGWSYGGIMTNYCIVNTNRFKAAISGASEVLYIANYGHDHYQKQFNIEFGPPWKNRPLYERLSPFNYVEKIQTPVLIMGGDIDWNVPIINSEQLFEALKTLGRPAELVVYPGEYHGFTKPTHLKDRFERYLAWYAKYLKGEGTGRPAATESKAM